MNCCGPSDKEKEKWEIEEAVRVLERAEEIKADKKLHGKAMAKMQEKMKLMQSVMGSKKKALGKMAKMMKDSD